MVLKNKILAVFVVTGFVAIMMAFRINDKMQVVCFGDSITQGAENNGGGWVAILSATHPEIDFINAGRNGRKTSDKKQLLPFLEKYPHADFYLFFLGVNDLKNGNDSLVRECVANMQWMVEQAKKTNAAARIIIMAPPGINLQTMSTINVEKKYNSNTQHSLEKLKKKYKLLAKEENVYFLSLLKTVSKENYLDGLHPDLKGQTEIADAAWKKLDKLIKQ